ncbi:MAG: hypothetical protein KN64_05965 [Sulfurovum sp. AS07-7]|nr:MAG: hypothetical protein KN64_05965 [Sulfurovum sp. AS07-7]
MHYKHKIPVDRILDIVKRLYSFETINIKDASTRYEVSTRTIARDFKSISKTIPLKNHNGNYSLDTSGQHPLGDELNYHLISSFAHDMKIKASCIDKGNFSKDIVSFAVKYEKLPKEVGLNILNAIKRSKKITFDYKKSRDDITNRIVSPIKIFIDNSSGIWYLVALDDKDSKIKKFILSKIRNFKESDIGFILSDDEQKEADEIKTVWHSSNHEIYTIKLYIAKEVALYFNDIKLHHTQVIEQIDIDGGLEISCMVTHKMEILPVIKSWMPHIFILEPKWLREELLDSVKIYQDKNKLIDI